MIIEATNVVIHLLKNITILHRTTAPDRIEAIGDRIYSDVIRSELFIAVTIDTRRIIDIKLRFSRLTTDRLSTGPSKFRLLIFIGFLLSTTGWGRVFDTSFNARLILLLRVSPCTTEGVL